MHSMKVMRTLALMMAVSIAVPESALGSAATGNTGVHGRLLEESESETPEATESTEHTKSTEATESTEQTKSTEATETPEATETTEQTESTEETETPEATETTEQTESTEETETPEATESTEQTGSSETPSTDTTGPSDETETTESTEETEAPESEENTNNGEAGFIDGIFVTSEQFTAVANRIKYNVEVPIEGLPSFITQEMVVGALKCQDEYGYPASVTIAQIIQESGYGKYGPGGSEGKGLSLLAYEYSNLFGIKGTGTAGSVSLDTMEMSPLGQLYGAKAGFRAYHTYTECIEDRGKILTEVYADLIEGVTDANTFAMRIAGRWATGLNYGLSLINIMKQYDLYRLDNMTVGSFGELIGFFANPCPGSTITSPFGYRDFDKKVHRGMDLGTGTANLPTYAAAAGTVTFAGWNDSGGNMIVIDHGDGLVTKYMHHCEMYVTVGQTVEKGQQIGLTGTTGHSTGNHLHFQVEENGVAMNPLKYLQDSGSGDVIRMRTRASVSNKNIPIEK